MQNAQLVPSAYLPLQAKRLAHDRILWINYDLLRELGVEVPAGGPNPEWIKKLSDAWGWSVPQKTDPAGAYTDETKEFWADGYGGVGLNGNRGSGRAAIAGGVQIKGIGRTPMVYKPDDFGHSHGGNPMVEAIMEPIWGEVLNSELPYGANRVVAVLETGTRTKQNPVQAVRALVVRVDPLRPAHYLPNDSVEGDALVWDRRRVSEVQKRLPTALPHPAGFKAASEADALRAGLFEFVDRISDQYATTYSKRLYHGATSPSNIGLSGEFLDFGTMTASPGYGRILTLDDDMPFGDTEVFKRDLLDQIMDGLRPTLSPELKAKLPSNEEMRRRFDEHYDRNLRRAMLLLTGVPRELIDPMLDSPQAKALSDILLKIARSGNDKVLKATIHIPRKQGDYDLEEILTRLASADHTPGGTLRYWATLKTTMVYSPFGSLLASRYAAFVDQVRDEAGRQGLKPKALDTFMAEAARARNRRTPLIYKDSLYAENLFRMAERHVHDDAIEKHINETIRESTRSYRDAGPYQVVLDQSVARPDGSYLRKVYDASKDSYRSLIRVHAPGPKASFFGYGVDTAELEAAELNHNGARVKARRKGNFVEFEFAGDVGKDLEGMTLDLGHERRIVVAPERIEERAEHGRDFCGPVIGALLMDL